MAEPSTTHGQILKLEGGQRRLPDDPGELLGEQSRALEVENGKRSSVNWVRNTPTATHQWHDLKVRISGIKVQGYLDGKLYLEHMLAQPVSGRIGLWSKADSHMYFSDYTVTRSN